MLARSPPACMVHTTISKMNKDSVFFIIVLIILGLAIVLPDMFYKISTNLGENTELTKEKVKKHQNDNENLDRCVSFHYRSGK